jgi:hypothetical protein
MSSIFSHASAPAANRCATGQDRVEDTSGRSAGISGSSTAGIDALTFGQTWLLNRSSVPVAAAVDVNSPDLIAAAL